MASSPGDLPGSSADPTGPPADSTGQIVVLFGPSGVGKSTIANELTEQCPDLWLSRSWTTRQRRSQESPQSYKFVSEAEFLAHRDADGFLEWDEFLGNYYGTPMPQAPAGKDVLLEITLHGAEQIVKQHPEALLIFVDTPSKREQKFRLRQRGGSASNRRRRVRLSRQERQQSQKLTQTRVINDDLVETVARICEIIQTFRLNRSR